MPDPARLACFQCGWSLVERPRALLITSHGEVADPCPSADTRVWYLREEGLPDWISSLVQQSGWTKGRINCPKCHSRLGGFDFVGGERCSCELSRVLPPVHLTRSKVDFKGAPCSDWGSSR